MLLLDLQELEKKLHEKSDDQLKTNKLETDQERAEDIINIRSLEKSKSL